MKSLRQLFILLFIALISVNAHAFDFGFAKEDAGQAGSFLDFSASARSLGMGRAHTAVADDASATYWNPAGLTQLDRKNLVTLYSFLDQDTGFGTFSIAQPTLDYGTFGLGVVSLRSANFEKREAVTGAKLGTFDQSDLGILLSHGFELSSRFSFGYTVKGISQKIDTFSDTGFGADIGLMAKVHPKLQAGFTIKNLVAPKITLKSVADKYPRDLRLGLKYQMKKNLMLAADFDKTENRSLKPLVGAEYQVNQILVLRGGFNEAEVSAGVGVKIKDWKIDYAFGYNDAAAGVKDLGMTHRLGFSVDFGGKLTDQGRSVRWVKKGQLALDLLRYQFDSSSQATRAEITPLVQAAEQVIEHQGFPKAQDLYEAQGFIAYFHGEYERCVQFFGEALSLDAENNAMSHRLEIVRAQMSEDQARKFVSKEMTLVKELYAKGDYQGAVASCKKILSFKPDYVEATAYMDDAQQHIDEPIKRELKIATLKIDQEEYLDAIKHLQTVKQLDPRNTEADRLMASSISALEKKARAQSMTKQMPSDKARVYEIEQDSAKSRQLYSQGLLLYSQGSLTAAVSAWENAVKYDSDNQLARNAYNRAVAEQQEKPAPTNQ